MCVVVLAAFFVVYSLVAHAPIEVSREVSPTHAVQSPAEPLVTVVFVGDMMFDRHIRKKAVVNGYDAIFDKVRTMFENADLVVGNLEGPITSYPSLYSHTGTSSSDILTFTFDPQVSRALSNARMSVVSIGNNHILNFGPDGLEQTRMRLMQAGISWFGDPLDARYSIFATTTEGIPIAFVAWNEFWRPNEEKTLADIGMLKEKGNVVIVYAHWGNEYEDTARGI